MESVGLPQPHQPLGLQDLFVEWRIEHVGLGWLLFLVRAEFSPFRRSVFCGSALSPERPDAIASGLMYLDFRALSLRNQPMCWWHRESSFAHPKANFYFFDSPGAEIRSLCTRVLLAGFFFVNGVGGFTGTNCGSCARTTSLCHQVR